MNNKGDFIWYDSKTKCFLKSKNLKKANLFEFLTTNCQQ